MQRRRRDIPAPFKREISQGWVARVRIDGKTHESRHEDYDDAQRWIIQHLIRDAREHLLWLESELRDLDQRR
jgi:hypothetical protein